MIFPLNKSRKAFLSVLLIFIFLFILTVPSYITYAEEETVAGWPQAPSVYGTSCILMDADTGAVLYSSNPHERLYPASITKIMTGLLAIENLNLNDTITYTNEILDSLPSDAAKLGLEVGETTTIHDALYALLLRSANETAVALAMKVSGTESAFADLMNARAAEAGALDTHFSNASGLHDDNHYTTAYDMAMIAKAAMNNSEFAAVWGCENYTLEATNISESYRIWNRHPLLLTNSEYYYSYAIGGKTGYTDEAGRTLVTAAEKNGMKLICVIMQSDDAHIFTDTAALFDYGFNNFIKVSISDEETRFGAGSSGIPVIDKLYGSNSGIFSLSSDSIVIPNTVALSEIPYTLEFLDTPQQNIIAYISYEYQGNYLGKAALMMNLSKVSNESSIGPKRTDIQTTSETAIKESIPVNIYLLIGLIAVGIVVVFILVKALKRHHRMAQMKKRRTY
jgi:D-alanyl-D-alanine carboxypeptidase